MLGFVLSSCADSGPTEFEMLEILNSLETSVNEKDLEGVMALFDDDAVAEETFRDITYDGTEEIEILWSGYLNTTFTGEFRDISVDGDTAMFTWAEVGTLFTKLWPVKIKVQNGKITYMDFYEDAQTVRTGEE